MWLVSVAHRVPRGQVSRPHRFLRVVDHVFQGEYVTTSKATLDGETYDDVREKTDNFNGGLVQAARNQGR